MSAAVEPEVFCILRSNRGWAVRKRRALRSLGAYADTPEGKGQAIAFAIVRAHETRGSVAMISPVTSSVEWLVDFKGEVA